MPGFDMVIRVGTRMVRIGSNVNQDWYGVERDNTITSPDWTRIASSPAAMTLHATMPIQQGGC